MRVITGSCRGKKLKTLESLDTRPTSDMVKEAIFSAVQFDIPGASVLDLFAGSGQLGIEALSRGANHCVFVDKNPSAVAVIKENINRCGLNSQSRVLNMDSIEYLKMAKTGLDIVLIDPPYRNGLVEKALESISPKLNDNALIVCEHEKELVLNDEYGDLVCRKRYKYGNICVTVFVKPVKEDDN